MFFEDSSGSVGAREQQDKARRAYLGLWIQDAVCTMVKSIREGLSDIKWHKRCVTVAGGKTLVAIGVGCIKGTVTTDEGVRTSTSLF
jgi:hypothetical protein